MSNELVVMESAIQQAVKDYPVLAKKIKEATVEIFGAEGIDVMWSPEFLKLVQSSSDYKDSSEIGTIRHSQTNELIHLKAVIPVGLFKTREWYDGKKKNSICRSRDGITGNVYGKCATCPHAEFKRKPDGSAEAPNCSETPILVLLDPKADEIYRLRLTVGNRDEYKVFRKKIIAARKLNFGYVRLTPVKNENSSNGSFKFDFAYKDGLTKEDAVKSQVALNVVASWRQATLDRYADEIDDVIDTPSGGAILDQDEDIVLDKEVVEEKPKTAAPKGKAPAKATAKAAKANATEKPGDYVPADVDETTESVDESEAEAEEVDIEVTSDDDDDGFVSA